MMFYVRRDLASLRGRSALSARTRGLALVFALVGAGCGDDGSGSPSDAGADAIADAIEDASGDVGGDVEDASRDTGSDVGADIDTDSGEDGTAPPGCGDGVVDDGETCDPPGSCPTACDDGVACTVDTLTGAAESCTAACRFQVVTACQDGDGCCPVGCAPEDDADCVASCGNGLVEPGERCDGNCPTACEGVDACTVGVLRGGADTCDATCGVETLDACQDGDGCCPIGCSGDTDDDCPGECLGADSDLTLGMRSQQVAGELAGFWGALGALERSALGELVPDGEARLLLVNRRSGDRVLLATEGAPSFDARVAAGTYDVALAVGEDDRAPFVLAADVAPEELDDGLDGDDVGGTVSGSFTVAGVDIPDSGYDDGRIRFVRRPGNQSFYVGDVSNGAYVATLPAGLYDVTYERVHSQGAVPMNRRAVVLESVVVEPPMDLDIDIPAVSIGGEVTLGGGEWPNSAYDSARLAFVSDASPDDEVRIAVAPGGAWSATLVPGVYDVLYQAVEPGPEVPANPSIVIARNLHISADGAVDIDVPVVPLEGAFLLAGDPPPESYYDSGELFLDPGELGERFPIGRTDDNGYVARIVPATYDVEYRSYQTGQAMPVNTRVVLDRDVSLSGGVYDIDVPVASLSGAITVGGASPPASSYDSGDLLAYDEYTGSTTLIGRTHHGSYLANMVPGTYDIYYRVAEFGGGVPVNSLVRIVDDLELAADQTFDIDVPMATVSGDMTLDGAPFPDSVLAYARISFVETGEPQPFLVANTYEGAYSVPVVPGSYQARYSWVTGDLPKNSGTPVTEVFTVDADITVDIEVMSQEMGGGFAIDGLGFDALGVDNDANYTLVDMRSGDRFELGRGGVERFTTRVLEGSYDVRYAHVRGADIPQNQDASIGCVDAIIPR